MPTNDRDWMMRDDHLPASARTNGQPRAEEEDGTPESEFDGQTAMGIIGQGKPLVRLHVIREPGKRISFQYSAMAAQSEYEPGRFVVRFMDIDKIWEVEVRGRNLWRAYDALTRHAAPWIQQASRDFEERKGQPIITKIDVRQAEEG